MSLAPWESPGKRLVLDDIEKRKGNMTKQHFETIAGVLADLRREWETTLDDPAREQADDLHFELRVRFADALAETNPRFDRDRFLKAAGGA